VYMFCRIKYKWHPVQENAANVFLLA